MSETISREAREASNAEIANEEWRNAGRPDVPPVGTHVQAALDRANEQAVAKACKRDGNWLDKWGACKVCGGEIPHGHTVNCDIYKLECEVRRAKEACKPLVEALEHIASYPEGETVNGSFDEPNSAQRARDALAAHARAPGV